MAVNSYPRQQSTKLIVTFLVLQTIIAAIIAGIWFILAAPTITWQLGLILAGTFLLLEAIAAYIVNIVASKPIHQVVNALLYAYSDKPFDKNSTVVELIRRLHAEKEPEEGITTETVFAQSLLDHLPIGIIALNAKREIIYANKAAPTRGGGKELNVNFTENDSLLGWLDTTAGKNISSSHWWKRLRQINIESEDTRQFFDMLALYQQNGESAIETILVSIDRTDDYSADEDDLDFTALAAHELRGPITVIKGYLDVLRQELDLTQDQVAFFERLDVSADRLTTYINNILNVSRYDRRHLQLHLKEETLTRVYQSVGDDLDLRARTHHRMLNVNIPENLPTIAADRGSLSEVIVNLVDNAIKYSNEGGLVVVNAGLKDNFVEVSVQDNGIGIPGALLGHIFDKFYRSHRSRENTVGTGLGLYITKAIVESHGGTVSVRSDEGHGTTFAFTIPTYASIADKLAKSDNSNEAMIDKKDKKFIKNHSMYRG
ncbi:MAG: PAS domain-containing sensor histidine kinase [Candidatus Saccharibacteria bacterium]|nr:PAS domain-containing sensor histidine kinase [Candidatus Saccharibacteria bacterium]